MSQIILDSDEEEDVSLEETSEIEPAAHSTMQSATVQTSSRESLHVSPSVSSLKCTGSQETLSRQILMAQLALVHPTPSSKGSAVENSKSLPDETLNIARTSRNQSIETPKNHNRSTSKTSPRHDTPTLANAPTGLGDDGAVPKEPNPKHVTDAADIANTTQPHAESPLRPQSSPHDTIMDSSSHQNSTSGRTARSATQERGLGNHDRIELFLNLPGTANDLTSLSGTKSLIDPEHITPPTALQDTSTADPFAQSETLLSQTDELQRETPSNHSLAHPEPSKAQKLAVVVEIEDNQVAHIDAKPTLQRSRKRKSEPEHSIDELNSEELIGLPKETYIARPTRSRGAPQGLDHSAFALPATPAKKSNSKLKRLKTTGSISLADRTTLCEMGFRSSQADQALADADGDVNGAVEFLTSRGYEISKAPRSESGKNSQESKGEDNASGCRKPSQEPRPAEKQEYSKGEAPPVARKKCERRTILEEEAEEEQNHIEDSDFEVENVSQVDEKEHKEDLPTPHKNMQGKNRSTRKSAPIMGHEIDEKTAEDEHSEEEGHGDDKESTIKVSVPKPSLAEPKKKRRGRPKKNQSMTRKGDEPGESITVETKVATTATTTESLSQAVLQDVDPNERRADAAGGNSHSEGTAAVDGPHGDAVTPEKARSTGPQSPKKPAHSPINSGKVPFKVGLSRRARIEPLLRVVRK